LEIGAPAQNPLLQTARRRTLAHVKENKTTRKSFNQNHFAQLRLLSVTKNSCKLAVKAEIDCTLKL